MKKIILKLLVISLIAFVYDRGLGWYLDTRYEANQGPHSNGHLNYYLHHENSDTLFIGSSRMAHHVDPEFFGDGAYNLSKNGMHIGYQAAVVDLLEQNHRLPSNVLVLHLEPEDMLLQYAEKLDADLHSLRYYYGSNDYITEEINNYSRFEFMKYYSELYRHSGNGISLIVNASQSRPSSNGYTPILGSVTDTELDTTKIDTVGIQSMIFDSPTLFNEKFILYVEHIRTICARNDIELICMTSPRRQHSTVRLRCAQILKSQLKKYDIDYLDYLTYPHSYYKRAGFWSDRSHLNKEGSAAFSEELYNRLNIKKKQVKPVVNNGLTELTLSGL